MKITKEMEKFIQLQRTDIESSKLLQQFEKSLVNDYGSIVNHIPIDCKRILDIGCGIGGIDLFLYYYYFGKPDIHLLDYSKTSEKIYYGYQKEGAIYNNLDLTKQFLTMNGVDKKNLAFYDAGNDEFPTKQFDLIISLLSWCFHYPLETYLEKVKKVKRGVMIIDVRNNTDQIETLKDNFESVKIIDESKTRKRVVVK